MNEFRPVFLVDWLTFTAKSCSNYDVKHVFELLQLNLDFEDFEHAHGNRNYRESLRFQNIVIYYNGVNEDNGICLDMSGSGCRTFDTHSNIDFFELLAFLFSDQQDFNITRLDIACDFKYDFVPLKEVSLQVLNEEYVSNTRSYNVMHSNTGITVYIGSSSSDTMVRIYDKKGERKSKNIDVDVDSWVRFELVLRRDSVYKFLNTYLSNSNIGGTFKGFVSDFVRFVDIKSSTRKSRCVTSDWYLKFLEDAEKILDISKLDKAYAFENLDYWVTDNMNSAVRTYIECVGVDTLLQRLDNNKKPLSSKYIDLKKSFKKDKPKPMPKARLMTSEEKKKFGF